MTTGTGAANLRRSEGPDRFRFNVRCRQFHDRPDLDLSGNPNCCCCNPCNTFRPYSLIKTGPDPPDIHAYKWCCRCIPRVIMLRFVPDEGDNYCCPERGFMIPLFPEDDPSEFVSVYSGAEFLGYSVTVTLGRAGGSGWDFGMTGTGTGTYDLGKCAWHIVASKDGSTVYDEYIYIDVLYEADQTGTGTGAGTFTGSCIKVPEVVIASEALFTLGTGSEAVECPGSIVLSDFDRSRLPFVEETETSDFVEAHAFNGGSIEEGDYPRFVYLCDRCEYGETATSLSSLAVDGLTYLVDTDINGKPSFVNGSRTLYWSGTSWTLSESAVILANGPLDSEMELLEPGLQSEYALDCPLGVWERTDDWLEYSGTGTGTGTGSLLSPDRYFCVTHADNYYFQPAGTCNRVCSRVCVRGPRHTATDAEPMLFQTFTWFEEWESTGTGGDPEVVRGWEFDNPATGFTERLYFEPDANYDVYVDGVKWTINYEVHSFGDPSRSYWYGELGGSPSWLYWDGANWVIMKGGNWVATGPSTKSPAGSYTPIPGYGDTYAVTLDTTVLSYGCRIRPALEASGEVYPPQAIDMERGCGSKLLVEIPEPGDPYPYLRTLSIRCGFCTCWKHVCGLCRCVPTYLCTTIVETSCTTGTGGITIPEVAITNLILEWNEDIFGWGDDDDPIRLLLIEDREGNCRVDIDYPGYEVPTLAGESEPNWPTYNCGEESWWREVDDDVQFPYIYYVDFTGCNNFYVSAMSHTPNCAPTPCEDATPCLDSCGSHPDTLYLTLTITPGNWCCGGPVEEPIPCPPITLEVELHYIDTGGYLPFGFEGFRCGYFGMIPSVVIDEGACCSLWFYLTLGRLYIRYLGPSGEECLNSDMDSNEIPLTESCDPYYATGDEPMTTFKVPQCRCLYPDYYNNVLGICDCDASVSVEITE